MPGPGGRLNRQGQKVDGNKGAQGGASSEPKLTFDLDKNKSQLREILEDGEEFYCVPFKDPSDL